MAYCYILKSVHHLKTYVGSTIDLEKRIVQHNKGLSLFTNRYKPWVLAYKERFMDLRDARLRERYFKSAAGRNFIKKNKLI